MATSSPSLSLTRRSDSAAIVSQSIRPRVSACAAERLGQVLDHRLGVGGGTDGGDDLGAAERRIHCPYATGASPSLRRMPPRCTVRGAVPAMTDAIVFEGVAHGATEPRGGQVVGVGGEHRLVGGNRFFSTTNALSRLGKYALRQDLGGGCIANNRVGGTKAALSSVRLSKAREREALRRAAERVARGEAEVVVVEPTGAETLLVTRFAGIECKAVFRERHQLEPGAQIGLEPQLDQVHLFDRQSGRRLVN